ncbi:MAG: SMI1/KNR4 family protein [Methanomassiliicoccaceae archaeon]|nr:SMI1/KNR4 family protein [Methanomassiliicoccaceae archaeon]
MDATKRGMTDLPPQLIDAIGAGVCFEYIDILPTYYADIDDFDWIQEGYRFNPLTGEDLTSDAEGGWRRGWHVFACNAMDDPFFVDLSEDDPGLPVYFSYHGEGSWEPVRVADSLARFVDLLRAIKARDAPSAFDLASLALGVDLGNRFWAEVLDTCMELEDE